MQGYAHHAEGDLENAIANYSEAIGKKPLSIYLLYRAQAYMQLKRYSDAMADANTAVRIDPMNPDVYRGRAKVVLDSSASAGFDGSAAIDDAQYACRLNGWRSPEYILILSQAYAAIGDSESAEQWKRRADSISASPARPEGTSPSTERKGSPSAHLSKKAAALSPESVAPAQRTSPTVAPE